MTDLHIGLHKEGGLWTVTLNRPEKANSLTRAMLVQLAEIAEAADRGVVGGAFLGRGDVLGLNGVVDFLAVDRDAPWRFYTKANGVPPDIDDGYLHLVADHYRLILATTKHQHWLSPPSRLRPRRLPGARWDL